MRERDIRVETLLGETSLSRHLKTANQMGIRFVLILGSKEFENDCWAVKDMEKKDSQIDVPDQQLGSYLEKVLGA